MIGQTSLFETRDAASFYFRVFAAPPVLTKLSSAARRSENSICAQR
jgi:hypothetical protein